MLKLRPSPVNREQRTMQGFTLIELLIVITVVALFSSVSLAYYNRLTAENSLLEQTSKVVNVLELAKKKALAAEGGQTCLVSFDGYRVTITTPTVYSLEKCCDGACTSVLSRNYTITAGVAVSSTVPLNVLFKPLSQPISSATITLKSAEIARCISIDISAAGSISKGDKFAC